MVSRNGAPGGQTGRPVGGRRWHMRITTGIGPQARGAVDRLRTLTGVTKMADMDSGMVSDGRSRRRALAVII